MFDRTIVLGTNAACILAPVAAQAPAPTTTAFDGTDVGQLIQELAREGLHAVTHYKPQADKVMRMHATGSAHIPSTIQRESSATNARCQPQSSTLVRRTVIEW